MHLTQGRLWDVSDRLTGVEAKTKSKCRPRIDSAASGALTKAALASQRAKLISKANFSSSASWFLLLRPALSQRLATIYFR